MVTKEHAPGGEHHGCTELCLSCTPETNTAQTNTPETNTTKELEKIKEKLTPEHKENKIRK